jgi:hypothetical protein
VSRKDPFCVIVLALMMDTGTVMLLNFLSDLVAVTTTLSPLEYKVSLINFVCPKSLLESRIGAISKNKRKRLFIEPQSSMIQ